VAALQIAMFKSQNTIAYVLTTNGRDIYSDMALISALSVRLTNPHLRIAVVSDYLSSQNLKAVKHPLLEIIDELRIVSVPYESPTHRNRFIKTQLCEFFDGAIINLDVDTIVRGSLSKVFASSDDFAAVANHHGITPREQLWCEDEKVINEMGWEISLPCYINTGVIFYKSNQAVRHFYLKWHALWSQERDKTGRGRDQPACYAALSETRLSFAELTPQFNWQTMVKLHGWDQARILHFYPHPKNQETIFGKLLKSVPHVSLATLKRLVKNAISDPYGWPNQDFVSKRIVKLKKSDSFSISEQLWLYGRRFAAIRFTLGKLLKNIGLGLR
jgi:hypothetical protein